MNEQRLIIRIVSWAIYNLLYAGILLLMELCERTSWQFDNAMPHSQVVFISGGCSYFDSEFLPRPVHTSLFKIRLDMRDVTNFVAHYSSYY
jgi:hypothetical protein